MRAKKLTRAVKTGPNSIDKHVGERVRMRRLMLGLSQEKIAKLLGLTFLQCRNTRKNEQKSERTEISANRLHRLASILQVPIPFFFDDVPTASR